MSDEHTAKLASGRKVTFTASKDENTCSHKNCDSEFVRINELDIPERMYCYKHCTSQKRNN